MRNKTHTMRRALAIVLIAMQLLALATLGIQADVIVISEMTVKKTDATTMRLDGKITAGEAWDQVDWSTDQHKLGSAEIPADSGMRFKSMWTKTEDEAALWFLIEMNDPTLDATGRAWNQDNVRVYIDEDGENTDSTKVAINQQNYGSAYVSSEFMSYAPNNMTSKGFEYKVGKKLDKSGYVVEVKYTYQNAELAVAEATVRANVAAVFANAENANNPAQAVWSRDSEKWSQSGLNDKDYFSNAGKLILSDDTVVSDVPVSLTSAMDVKQALADKMVLDGAVTMGEAWELVDWSTDQNKLGSAEIPADSRMRFKSMWTKTESEAALWFLIDMDDSTLDATGRAWNQDNVRVYIDEDGVNTDSAKVAINQENYGSLYVSSEFMSYAPNTMSSKGFAYKVEKKADGSGYLVEVKYTYENAALAVAGAVVRANVASVFANAENANNPAQAVWSRDPDKWGQTGLNDKDCFAHAGSLTLVEDLVEAWLAPVLNAKQTTVSSVKIDGKVTDADVWDRAEWSDPATAYNATAIATPGNTAYDATYADYGYRFKTLWAKDGEDKAYLFFLVDVNDTHLTSEKRAWASDNIRLFIDETGEAPSGTEAKREIGMEYISSEFMSYATSETVAGFKYRCAKKADGSGYILEVRYTLMNPALAVAGQTVKVNVVGTNADSTNDDGAHFAQQFSWTLNPKLWDSMKKIEYVDHAGVVTLVEDMVKLEEQTPTPPSDTTEDPKDTVAPGETTQAPAGTNEAPAVTTEASNATTEAPADTSKGCGAGMGLAVLPVLALLGAAFTSKRKED